MFNVVMLCITFEETLNDHFFCKHHMITDIIIEVGIDDLERLYIVPEKKSFSLIYRTATEVHWDSKGKFLYSPKPREWSYLNWYKHIVGVVDTECGCKLILSANTKWTNVPDELKDKILQA